MTRAVTPHLMVAHLLYTNFHLLTLLVHRGASPPVTHQLDREGMRDCREQAWVIVKWYVLFANEDTHDKNITKTGTVSSQDTGDVEEQGPEREK
jgi:hypothetical protein